MMLRGTLDALSFSTSVLCTRLPQDLLLNPGTSYVLMPERWFRFGLSGLLSRFNLTLGSVLVRKQLKSLVEAPPGGNEER